MKPHQSLPDANLLPPAGGTYLLLFDVPETVTFQAGRRLGQVTLAAGRVVYAGSALGPGGLRARVGRHLRSEKKQHWHVDYLTAVCPVGAVWYAVSDDRLECVWAAALRAIPGVTAPVVGFGASDCACDSHLLYMPDVSVIPAALAAWSVTFFSVPGRGYLLY